MHDHENGNEAPQVDPEVLDDLEALQELAKSSDRYTRAVARAQLGAIDAHVQQAQRAAAEREWKHLTADVDPDVKARAEKLLRNRSVNDMKTALKFAARMEDDDEDDDTDTASERAPSRRERTPARREPARESTMTEAQFNARLERFDANSPEGFRAKKEFYAKNKDRVRR